jgi:hypothetical protein
LGRYDFSPRLSIQLQRHLEKTAALLERKERVTILCILKNKVLQLLNVSSRLKFPDENKHL